MKKIKHKFYEFKNIAEEEASLYIYGALTDDKDNDWFPSEQDVDLKDFKSAIDNLKNGSKLNIFVNSPGGSVFASSTMASMLQRVQETKNIKIVSYIDGLCASATSFLIMVSDEIKLYDNSMLMVHKPMSIAFGNADDMQKEIDTLNSIEENVMMPLYMKKAKVDEATIKNLIDAESWLSAKEVDKYFKVDLLGTNKECTACVDLDLFKKYKNVPEELKEEAEAEEEELEKIVPESDDPNQEETLVIEPSESEPTKEEENEESSEDKPLEEQKESEEDGESEEEEVKEEPKQHEDVDKPQNIDYSYFENKLKSLKGE